MFVNFILLTGCFIASSLFVKAQTVSLWLNDTSVITLTQIPFDLSGRQVEFDLERNIPIAIGGVPIFGTDGGWPQFELQSASLSIGKASFLLETTAMYNAWFGSDAQAFRFRLIYDGNDRYRLRANFSDAAGSYSVEWLIVGTSSIRTVLTNDDWRFECLD